VPAFVPIRAFSGLVADRVDPARLDAGRIDAYCARLPWRELFLRLRNAPAPFLAALYLRRMLAAAGIRFDRTKGGNMSIDFSGAPRAWEEGEEQLRCAPRSEARKAVEHGKAVMRMPYRREITNGTGAVMAARSSASATRSSTLHSRRFMGAIKILRRSALQCNFLAPAGPPHVSIAEARVLRGGRRIVYGEVYVRSGTEIVAHARSTSSTAILPEKPPKSGHFTS